MSALLNGRQFQLWEYRVSHGSLLIRSPAGPETNTSIDIVCVGVEYIAAPRHLGEVRLSEVTQLELKHLSIILRKELTQSHVWVLEGSWGRCLLVAASIKIQEHRGDIFDSPFVG